jgi:ribulose-5-phosphate 4-epimerase/fuculose-1-phosphate aldolase
VIYEHQKDVNAVIHVHHPALWKKLLEILPATGKHIEYGTPAMAREILRLFEESNLAEEKIFAMGGHEEGIVSFGKDLDEAGEKIFEML